MKLFGPVHVYVAPEIVPAVKLKVVPRQTGVLLDAEGAPGVWLMVTEVVLAELPHPLTIAVTE